MPRNQVVPSKLGFMTVNHKGHHDGTVVTSSPRHASLSKVSRSRRLRRRRAGKASAAVYNLLGQSMRNSSVPSLTYLDINSLRWQLDATKLAALHTAPFDCRRMLRIHCISPRIGTRQPQRTTLRMAQLWSCYTPPAFTRRPGRRRSTRSSG